MQQKPRWWTDADKVACVDIHKGYRSAIRWLRGDRDCPATAEVGGDPFHIIRLANQALTACRQRTRQETTGHRGRNGDAAYRIHKLQLMGSERLDPTGRERIQTALDAGDPTTRSSIAGAAEGKVRTVFKARDPQESAAWCRAPETAPGLHRLAKTLTRWHDEISASVATRTRNGRAEAANAKTKDIKRSARGFQNFADYWHGILLAAGTKPRETQPVTEIRTRRPRFVA